MTVIRPESTDTGSIALGLECHVHSLPLVRSVVKSVVTFPGVDAQSGFLVAVSEVFTNAVHAHQRARTDREIEIEILVGDPTVVRVRDHGSGFPFDGSGDRRAPDPTIESGRGLLIARAFVPDLSIDTGSDGTTVTLPVPTAAVR